ncbi:hypothetical protein OV079_01580 [Nannocystis pusilla]|uniref:Uncharacterized protein n=1 Tax=Nannocystis pusilla TaxID=889268 RepID=A0A9X3EIF1_9BACT|nr:hypothetical protein [Nannocystis pusilla]MCY1004280.1 hypothetical protein [Nannocystis pusilla]
MASGAPTNTSLVAGSTMVMSCGGSPVVSGKVSESDSLVVTAIEAAAAGTTPSSETTRAEMRKPREGMKTGYQPAQARSTATPLSRSRRRRQRAGAWTWPKGHVQTKS